MLCLFLFWDSHPPFEQPHLLVTTISQNKKWQALTTCWSPFRLGDLPVWVLYNWTLGKFIGRKQFVFRLWGVYGVGETEGMAQNSGCVQYLGTQEDAYNALRKALARMVRYFLIPTASCMQGASMFSSSLLELPKWIQSLLATTSSQCLENYRGIEPHWYEYPRRIFLYLGIDKIDIGLKDNAFDDVNSL
jgi:hypothetical protein